MNTAQIAIIGGGPAGLSAAIAAARSGAATILLDEQPALGGQLRYRLGSLRQRQADGLIEQARNAGVDLRAGALAWGLFPDNLIGVVENGTSYELRVERLILATGSTDLPWPFPGGSLPGVFSARGLLILLHIHRVRPGRRFVVLGGATADEVAEAIELAGGLVVARHDPAASAEPVRAEGAGGVTAVWIGERRLAADSIVVAVGRKPDIQLAQMAETDLGHSDVLGGWVPVRTSHPVTSNSSILVAGDAAGICEVSIALAEGTLAGLRAAADLDLIAEAMVEEAAAELLRVAAERVGAVETLTPRYVQGAPLFATVEGA